MADINGVMLSNKPTKKTKGKSKIPMQKISDKKSLFVSFSKRKNGLFKKSALLASMFPTEVQMASIVFSPTGKPFSFGYPNPDFVIARFLGQHGRVNVLDHKEETKEGQGVFWWDDLNVDNMSLEQLLELKSSLEEVKDLAFQKAIDVSTAESQVC